MKHIDLSTWTTCSDGYRKSYDTVCHLRVWQSGAPSGKWHWRVESWKTNDTLLQGKSSDVHQALQTVLTAGVRIVSDAIRAWRTELERMQVDLAGKIRDSDLPQG